MVTINKVVYNVVTNTTDESMPEEQSIVELVEAVQSNTRSKEKSERLITEGNVGFVQIPRFLHPMDFSGMSQQAALGLTPDVQFIIVDWSDPAGVAEVIEDVVKTNNGNQEHQIAVENVFVLSPNMQRGEREADSDFEKKQAAYRRLLELVQSKINEIFYF